jgi:Tol biopolymer transport system component
VDSGARQQITFPSDGEMGDHCVSASPDGSRMLFSRALLRAEWSGKTYILTMGKAAPAGARMKPVEAAVNKCAAWSGDGERMIYAWGLGLWSVPADKSGAAPALIVETGRGANWPAISRDGRRMAYARKVGGNLDIWELPVSASEEAAGTATKLVSSSRDQFAPQFSPDGSKVAFSSGRAEVSEIWVCNRDGSGCTQLTWTDSANTGDPSWSPDGRSLAYYSTLGGRARIYTIPAQGGEAHPVTPEGMDALHPCWSHDGKWIYFTSRQDGAYQVWKIALQGGRPLQVTQQGGYGPAESPDGRWLYYDANADDDSSLWRMPASGGKPEQVLSSVIFHNFAVVSRGIYFIADSERGQAIQFYDPALRRSRPVAPIRSGYMGLSASPDARTLLYTQTAPASSQVYLVDNFR